MTIISRDVASGRDVIDPDVLRFESESSILAIWLFTEMGRTVATWLMSTLIEVTATSDGVVSVTRDSVEIEVVSDWVALDTSDSAFAADVLSLFDLMGFRVGGAASENGGLSCLEFCGATTAA